MTQAEGISISGELVKNLKDKRFIVGASPCYKEIDDLKNAGQKVRRLIIAVVIYENRAVMDYYPNKKSIKTMVNLYGAEMDNWVGKMFEWKAVEQDFLGMTKWVAYVKDAKIDIPQDAKI